MSLANVLEPSNLSDFSNGPQNSTNAESQILPSPVHGEIAEERKSHCSDPKPKQEELKCEKCLPKTLLTSDVLIAANQQYILQNLEQPLVAWIPDWRVMKDPETGESLVDQTSGKPLFGYMPELIESYTSVFGRAGIRLLLLLNDQKVQDWVERIDGIMIPGGRDIDPALYGEQNTHSVFDKDDSQRRFSLCKNWV